MTDLTKIEKPFGMLSEKKQKALCNYKGGIELFNGSTWVDKLHDNFFRTRTYRAAPVTLPDWPPGLAPKWQWIAMDDAGWIYSYEYKPDDDGAATWLHQKGCRNITDLFENLSFDGIHWRDAIIQRPEGV